MSSPIRIVRIITRLNIGGPAIQAITLSSRMQAHGFDTLLVYGRLGPGEGDMSPLLRESGATAVHMPALCRPITPVRDLQSCWRLYRLLCRFRPALVHTHMAKAGTVGRLATMAYNVTHGRKSPARVVHTYHGHVFEGYFSSAITKVFLAIERALARRTDAIVAVSELIRRELLETYSIGRPDQIRVIPLGFDLAPFAAVNQHTRTEARVALAVPADAPVVSTVGRLTAIKRHDLFLEMARRVANVYPGALFLIAGDGERRVQLERQASELGLGSCVRFLGWRRDLATIYAATDLFVLTSRNEGTPVAVIEAMASGTPPIATAVGGVPDVLSSTDVGVLVPPDDIDALVRAVSAALEDPITRRQMGNRARASVLARYQQERLIDDIARLYTDLLAGQHRT